MPQKRPSKKIKQPSNFSFITDTSVRNKIKDSLEVATLLYLQERSGKFFIGVSKEIRRIIILYEASIIEAVLLFLFKKRNFSLPKVEYKNPNKLANIYQIDKKFDVVIAQQIQTKKSDNELMLDVLVNFFRRQKVISSNLSQKIRNTKNVRNTFHLTKSRKGIHCGSIAVRNSADAVLETFIAVDLYLKKTSNNK